MDQVTGCSNPIENIVNIPEPSIEEVRNYSIPDESTTLITTNEQLKNTTGSLKTKVLDAMAKNLRDGSIPSGTRKVKKTIAAIPMITRKRKKTMIIDSIKTLKKQNGASLEDICNHMADNYQVNMELWEPSVSKFLKNNVQNGVLEKTNEAAGKERFKLTESVTNENEPQNLLSKDGMQSKVEKRKVDDLLESRELIKIDDQSVSSDLEKHSKNEAGEGSTVIENSEAVPGPTKDVISQTETTI